MSLKVLRTITLRTIKTFGNYIGVILKQYTCARVPFKGYRENSHIQISFGFHLLSVSIQTFYRPLLNYSEAYVIKMLKCQQGKRRMYE